jgi:hypothetical protein
MEDVMSLGVSIGRRITEKRGEKDVEGVECCPDADHEICDSEFTRWTKESYRNGSSDFWQFWEVRVGSLFQRMNVDKINSAGEPLAQLKPVLEEINLLSETLPSRIDQDRMKWFKYWTNRAVELYGDEAYITFR